MKSTIEVRTEIYKLLNVPRIKDMISGGVYNGFRPHNSNKEDIVVNVISLGRGTLQDGVANVNIYVPDAIGNSKGETIYLPNSTRLKAIKDAVLPILDEFHGPDFSLWCESTAEIAEPDIKQHFINLRIRVSFHNPH